MSMEALRVRSCKETRRVLYRAGRRMGGGYTLLRTARASGRFGRFLLRVALPYKSLLTEDLQLTNRVMERFFTTPSSTCRIPRSGECQSKAARKLECLLWSAPTTGPIGPSWTAESS